METSQEGPAAPHRLGRVQGGPRWSEPHSWLQHLYTFGRGDASTSVHDADKLVGAALGKAGFPSEEEKILETTALRSQGTLPSRKEHHNLPLGQQSSESVHM